MQETKSKRKTIQQQFDEMDQKFKRMTNLFNVMGDLLMMHSNAMVTISERLGIDMDVITIKKEEDVQQTTTETK